MKLRNASYEVNISIDPTYTLGSADNVMKYDHILVAHGLEHGDYYSTFCINIISGEQESTIALIGGADCGDSECAVLEGDILTILQNEFITGIDLAKCNILHSRKIPHSHANYALFRVSGGLVIYGELDIIGLDSNYNVVWKYGARDIITGFKILENRIEYSDWSGYDYEIDLDKAWHTNDQP